VCVGLLFIALLFCIHTYACKYLRHILHVYIGYIYTIYEYFRFQHIFLKYTCMCMYLNIQKHYTRYYTNAYYEKANFYFGCCLCT